MGSVVRPFTALDGSEVARIILNDIKNQLDNDYRFRKNLTYPQVSWRWKIAIDVYPSEPSQFTVEAEVKIVKAPNADIPPDAPTVEIDLQGGQTVAAPLGGSTADAARRNAGIPVPAPRAVRGPGGARVIVDAPNVDHVAQPKSSGSEERANVEHGGKIFARSVTLKTAAAPDGVEVAPQAGASPTIDDVQTILSREKPEE